FGILEVGLGGRLDATNVVVPEVSVITHLAVEHTKYLGNTIDEIAMEKAGIIKEGVPVVVADKPIPEAIVRTCRERSSELIAVGTDIQYERIDLGLDGQRFLVKGDSEFEIEIKLLGLHQLQNASTAFGVIEALRRSGYGIPDAAISRGFSRTFWPGRFQIAMRNPFLVLDAAHNADAALQLRRTVDETLQYKRSFLILGILDDKDLRSFAEALTPIADTLIAVEPNSPRAFSAKEIAREMEGYVEEVRVIPDVVSALRNALSNCGRNDLVCVSGSNTTVGEAMQYLKGAKQWER
ncbi:MAG: bifunctional folylpolyglutamate synthase/dihydrofolate synthase, partial [Thermoplasmata archaeon]